ncbi:hypothetical protein AAEU33_20350 [Chryseobacterium sp. Chry.R1]|uniref:hypothetical protein n=1 Tax=Chryseobacterium sp. Chry.R1 TaxID=3139392 RepID=UPI0031F82813
MKLKKIMSLLLLVLVMKGIYGQVGINTSNPQGTFHIDGNKDNPSSGIPNSNQQANDVIVTKEGNEGIGIISPTNKLHIKGVNPLRMQGLKKGSSSTDSLLVVDPSGVVKTIGALNVLSIPTPTVFILETNQNNFLNGIAEGEKQPLNMGLVKNTIDGLVYAGGTVTLPPGVYMMTLVYEGTHNKTGCNLSSYFVDFPLNDNDLTRIHSTAAHSEGGNSNHGGTITYVTSISKKRNWTLHLGRGQSGNCSGTGMTLRGKSTQLLIFKIGD